MTVTELKALSRGAMVRGVVPDDVVTIVDVQCHAAAAEADPGHRAIQGARGLAYSVVTRKASSVPNSSLRYDHGRPAMRSRNRAS